MKDTQAASPARAIAALWHALHVEIHTRAALLWAWEAGTLGGVPVVAISEAEGRAWLCGRWRPSWGKA